MVRPAPATWSEGDLNYDNAITISDFIDLAANFGKTLDEPSAATSVAALSEASTRAKSAKTRLTHHRQGFLLTIFHKY